MPEPLPHSARRLWPAILTLAFFAGLALVTSLTVIGLVRRHEWTVKLFGEERADDWHYAIAHAVERWLPHDADADTMPDVMEMLRGHSPFDYYNGRECTLLVRSDLFRPSAFVYAGGSVSLQVQHRVNGSPSGAAPGTRLSLGGQGGRFTRIERRYSYEDDFDPATGEMRGVNNAGTGGHVLYEPPDTPGREVTVTARTQGARKVSGQMTVRILGHAGEPVPARSVFSTRMRTAPPTVSADRLSSGLVRVTWEPIAGDHLGVAIEFLEYRKKWIIVSDAPPQADQWEFPEDVVAVNPPKPLTPAHFRVVPYRR